MTTAGPAPFVVGAARTELRGDGGASSESFARRRAFACEGSIDPPFLELLARILRGAAFSPDAVAGLGHREMETPNRAGAALTLALKRAGLVRWIEETTGCGPLEGIDGRVVRTRADPAHRLDWHDDLNVPGRRLAVTVNLSDEPFAGGIFELRDSRTKELLLRHRHGAPGSALVFAVAPGLEHRVTPVTSGGPRCVYAGWFVAGGREGARE